MHYGFKEAPFSAQEARAFYFDYCREMYSDDFGVTRERYETDLQK